MLAHINSLLTWLPHLTVHKALCFSKFSGSFPKTTQVGWGSILSQVGMILECLPPSRLTCFLSFLICVTGITIPT